MPSAADPALAGLEVYVVGGAVRDQLLGLEPGDRDWVVVGASPREMVERGFTPVGGDFPVFLHPVSHEEYALARTERKSGKGYQGFTFHCDPDVTLEEDLQRRDLTINAMAQDSSGRLIDPYHGQQDIDARLFRHVSPAFSEDPVRILRLARFAARFPDFTIAPETLALCQAMGKAGEVDALVPERVWKEISRGLMAQRPARLIEVLEATEALPRIAPELITTSALLAQLDHAARQQQPLACRWGLLAAETPELAALHRRLRVPNDCADAARLIQMLEASLPQADTMDARLQILEKSDALRKPARFLSLLPVLALRIPVDASLWSARLDAIQRINAGAIAQTCAHPAQIKEALRQARLDALTALER